MAGDVKIFDVKNTDALATDLVTASTIKAVVPPPKRGAYQRLRFALRLLGVGHFEFEREHDDRP